MNHVLDAIKCVGCECEGFSLLVVVVIGLGNLYPDLRHRSPGYARMKVLALGWSVVYKTGQWDSEY